MDANIGNGAARLLLGDCLERLRDLEDNSVDSVVTDPPYELGFMGKSWDASGVAFRGEVWSECLRVLKPGGHLLAFSGSRTYHRMACAIEDAGFEIRDQIMWVYGSGFPKSMSIVKQLEKIPVEDSPSWVDCMDDREKWLDLYRSLGTALKPAHEPICIARKPVVGNVAANVLQHGTGAINVDGCRVATDPRVDDTRLGGMGTWNTGKMAANVYEGGYSGETVGSSPLGRWPANLIHDGSEEVVALFPASKGQLGAVTGDEPSSKTNAVYGDFHGRPASQPRGDTGSAARFFKQCGYDDEDIEAARLFYCAKASRRDRNEGLEDPGHQFEHGATLRKIENTETKGNTHPTVKPTDLMRYLCRLVTPPGGLVLDPFTGSGSTGKAAMLEGFRFIGCELGAEYLAIASARIEHAHGAANPEPVASAPEPQLSLFA